LVALGYKAGDADKAVRKAAEALGEDTSTEDLIRAAFSKKR
jgi:Holliday junction resolvasome RuvABC DNA-binding subunit